MRPDSPAGLYARPKETGAQPSTYRGTPGVRERLRRQGEVPRRPLIESSVIPKWQRAKAKDPGLRLTKNRAQRAAESGQLASRKTRQQAAVRLPRECEAKECTNSFVPFRFTQRFCSTRCRKNGQNERRPSRVRARPLPRACRHCGNTFQPDQHQIRLCSEECRLARRKKLEESYYSASRKRGDPSKEKPCRECGQPFLPDTTAHQICSKECRAVRKRRNDRESLLRSRGQGVGA